MQGSAEQLRARRGSLGGPAPGDDECADDVGNEQKSQGQVVAEEIRSGVIVLPLSTRQATSYAEVGRDTRWVRTTNSSAIRSPPRPSLSASSASMTATAAASAMKVQHDERDGDELHEVQRELMARYPS
jgi:hypothetical protein